MKTKKKRRLKKILLWILGILLAIVLFLFIYGKWVLPLKPPKIQDTSALQLQRKCVSLNFYTLGNNWLRKSNSGLWEMYVEGDPFTMGVVNGKLVKDLNIKQENAFVHQIRRYILSNFYLNFLNFFVSYFNRNLNTYTPKEYLEEIYGVSCSASDAFEQYGNAYHRMLNYHAAHDLGHALQNLHMVGCTSFSVWNEKSADNNLLVGRNFDFYFGDEFAANKMVCFFHPAKGYRFMTVSWAGMIGAVSGMNEKGLTVTINAANSGIPLGAKTPITLVTREILQYASSIREAIAIAEKRHIFVSESIMVGSAADNRTVVIEKTPEESDVYESGTNSIICTNHFQSKKLLNSPKNKEFMQQSSSVYRYQRVKELLDQKEQITVQDMATILRDQKGLKSANIGMGNEKAINQLLAHHSIIFEPGKLRVWVSAAPWQLGKYICYDLNKIFFLYSEMQTDHEICEQSLNIPEDTFLHSENYKNFLFYKKTLPDIKNYVYLGSVKNLAKVTVEKFEKANPEFYYTYETLGDYYFYKKQYAKAESYYRKALQKEIPGISESEKIEKAAGKCSEKSRRN